MIKFKSFIKENKDDISSLSIFDIDDTLFSTTTYIRVIKNNKLVKKLTPSEYNEYSLSDGESFDFSEFRSSKVFFDTAKPVDSVFKTAKSIINKFSGDKNKKIIVVTARADLDDRELFLSTFKKYGFNVDNVRIERAGNLKKTSGAESKKVIIRRFLKKKTYNIVRMFDDHHENLNKFLELKAEFPDSEFIAYYVNKDGNFSKYGN